ncbi:MAG: N-acetylglucosamine-1-phosphate [Prolixibacteraceae bacterium]|nr:MAG: N-acetylglucosamine-1-phosphate [Prolixibacteraceae bacterium]
MQRIEKYGIVLRVVKEEDAEFILKLRTDVKLSRFISHTVPDLEAQIKWIKKYKKREESGQEYYFIAEDKKGEKYGTIRIYNFDDNSFEIGSWLFLPKSPLGMAIKAQFIGFELGFERLKAEFCRLEVRKKNTAVLRYFQNFEKVMVREDELNYYFLLSKGNFFKRRGEIPFFNTKTKKPEVNLFIHPTAEVQSVNIGEGTSIWQYCVVLKDAVIGKNCNLNFNVFVENDVIIGDNVTVKSGVQLWDGLRIENNVFISPNVAFTNDISPRSKLYPLQFLRTTVKEGASIGANSTIIGGVTIGKFAMIGAGSVITKNVPDYNLWYGHPASFKAYICECGKKLDSRLICSSCGKTYIMFNGTIEVAYRKLYK